MNLKRVLRDLKKAPLKNISFILLITLSVTVIIGFSRSSFSFLQTVHALYATCHVEDGQFTLLSPLTPKQLHALSKRFNITLEENLTQDEELKEASKKQGTTVTLRLIQSDKSLNQTQLIKGNLPTSTYDLLLDPRFAEAQGYQVGDSLFIGGCHFNIVGFGISPDYVYTLKQPSDFVNSPNTFGVAYLTQKGFDKIQNDKATYSTYSYASPSLNAAALENFLQDHYTLLNFMTRQDNSRIETVFNDAKSPIYMSIIMGGLLLVVIAFIISISIKNTIATESQTIGVLYAQGFNEKELLRYYMILPLLLVALGTGIGYVLGVYLSKPLLFLQMAQYTVPDVILRDSWTLIGVGILLPFALTLSITYFSIKKALHQTPLSLLRGVHSHQKITPLEKCFTFPSLSFFPKFRLKNMIREKGSMLALFFGTLLAMFILSTALYMKDSATYYIHTLEDTVPYEYCYTFTTTKALHQYAHQGELTTLKSVKATLNNRERHISVQGIRPDTTFFNYSELASLLEGEVLISPSLHYKYGLEIGDTLTLKESAKNKTYTVTIKGFSSYDYGPYLYLSTAYFNRLFNLHTQGFNALLTDHALEIPDHLLGSRSSKQEMIASLASLIDMIHVLTGIMIGVAVGILITVIYMLLKMIIDKSQINISMVKIFGYNKREINRLYLKGHLPFLIAGTLLGIPAGHIICKFFYDSVLANMDQYFLLVLTPMSLLLIFAVMYFAYYIALYLLKRNINRVALTEALKNRE